MTSSPYLSLSESKVAVAGAGVTGTSVAKALEKLGAVITLVDDNVTEVEDFAVLAPSAITEDDFDYLMISPGWREDHPLVQLARSCGKAILNEIDLAWHLKTIHAPAQKWLALTGTNGKTTTVEMTAHILNHAGVKAIACGNVGNTVVDAVMSKENYDYLILELSSFQLHWAENPQFVSAAILNIAQDHVDWHGSFDAYRSDKFKILQSCSTAILNGDDPEVVVPASHWLGRKVFFTLDTPKPGELGLIEELLVDRAFVADPQEATMIAELTEVIPTAPHQVANALASAGLALTIGISHEKIREAISTFRPGKHRIETVAIIDGIQWVDDSKATNPHAAGASVTSFEKVIWIAGGLAKGASMEELVVRIARRLEAVILIGHDREIIHAELLKHAPDVPVHFVDTPHGYIKGSEDNLFMESVVSKAREIAGENSVILLAPACASMDQFVSYADRGNRFAAAVKNLEGTHG